MAVSSVSPNASQAYYTSVVANQAAAAAPTSLGGGDSVSNSGSSPDSGTYSGAHSPPPAGTDSAAAAPAQHHKKDKKLTPAAMAGVIAGSVGGALVLTGLGYGGLRQGGWFRKNTASTETAAEQTQNPPAAESIGSQGSDAQSELDEAEIRNADETSQSDEVSKSKENPNGAKPAESTSSQVPQNPAEGKQSEHKAEATSPAGAGKITDSSSRASRNANNGRAKLETKQLQIRVGQALARAGAQPIHFVK